MRPDESHLLGIPRSRAIVTKPDPNHEKGSRGFPRLSAGAKTRHAELFSVARVRPRTSKGITDLLLLRFVRLKRRQSL